MRRRLILFVVLAIACSAFAASLGAGAAGAQTLPGEPPAPGDVGPGTPAYAVGHRSISVPVEAGRTLTGNVWYPSDGAAAADVPFAVYAIPGASYTSTVAHEDAPVASGGPFPVVVYSHGSGGQGFISAFLTEALAGRGYVVVAVDHAGDTAIDQFTNTTLAAADNARNRIRDIGAEIAALAAANADSASPYAGKIDVGNIGLVGHSAGGGGVLLGLAGRDTTAPLPNVKAVVGMGTYVDQLTGADLKHDRAPTMLISGTLDTTTPIAKETVRAWKDIAGRPLYRVDLKGAGHQSYTDLCYYTKLVAARPNLPAAIASAITSRADQACTAEFLPVETAHKLVDGYVVAFFDRYVKGEVTAAKQLRNVDPKVVRFQVKR
ncbi:MAG: hypothetical protein WCI50_00450 [Actinomycetes bacterium]